MKLWLCFLLTRALDAIVRFHLLATGRCPIHGTRVQWIKDRPYCWRCDCSRLHGRHGEPERA